MTKLINSHIHSILVGSKLGDGCFVKKSPTHNTYVCFKHAFDQYEYLNWKFNELSTLINKSDLTQRNFGEDFKETWQPQYYFSLASNPELNSYYAMSDYDAINSLDALSFSVWLLDDGNIYRNCTRISCARFSDELREFACLAIYDKFGIKAVPYNKAGKGYIRIPSTEYILVKNLVLSSVPHLDVVRNKFGLAFPDSLPIKVNSLNKNLPPLCFISGKSDWIDLRASKTYYYKEGEAFVIPLGVAMQLPKGFEAHVVPRSSTFKNYGLLMVNSMGVIDNSYCGDDDEWMFPAYAMKDGVVHEGDRICQFRIMKKMDYLDIEFVDMLGNPNRNGFGSTGTR